VTRQYIIAAIVGLILVSLGLGGFPPAIAVAITLAGGDPDDDVGGVALIPRHAHRTISE
jgi:hypothetical protein